MSRRGCYPHRPSVTCISIDATMKIMNVHNTPLAQHRGSIGDDRPVHSPWLRTHWLVYAPPLNNMLKFRGLPSNTSCLSQTTHISVTPHARSEFRYWPSHSLLKICCAMVTPYIAYTSTQLTVGYRWHDLSWWTAHEGTLHLLTPLHM